MIEFIKERWDIIFLSLAILVQWGVIINILGRMEYLRRCIVILNMQNKKIKKHIEDNNEQHEKIKDAIDDLCTLTKRYARVAEEEEDKK